jgi:predicted amidohydrolase YtcJ
MHRSLPAKILLIAALLAGTAAHAQPADRIWFGGPILTMNDGAMRAEAVAVAGGKITAVGSRADVMKTRGPRTEMVDLQGRALVPGFLDPHGHIFLGGLQALSANIQSPPDGKVTDIPSLVNAVKEWRQANAATVQKVNLILGFGYDNAQLRELRHPTAAELDAISSDIPVVLVHQSGHLASVNSAALKAIGFDAATKDPAGGVIQRKPGTTEPNGTLEETAMFPIMTKLLPGIGADGMRAFAREGAKLWASYGYTTAQEGRASPDVTKLLQQVAAAGGFANDIVVYPDVMTGRDFIKASVSPTYVNRLRVGGAKLSLDGSPQGFTAWRDKPYHDPVGNYSKGYSGYATVSAEDAFSAIQWATENNIQLLTHANGERASDLQIAAHTAAQARFPQGATQRHVLIHGQFLREDQLDSYKRLGVIPSLFPMHTFYWGDWHLAHTVGPVAGQNISPTGWAVKRGMIFTTHHDAPVAFPDSMRVLDATVTRRSRTGVVVGPDQRVDPITALKAMTIWAAYQYREEDRKGSLEPGKLADFAILSKDPTAVQPTSIADIKVLETVKEGKSIFTRAGTKTAASPPDITPFLAVAAGHGAAQPAPAFGAFATPAGETAEGCLHDTLFHLAEAMASAAGTR